MGNGNVTGTPKKYFLAIACLGEPDDPFPLRRTEDRDIAAPAVVIVARYGDIALPPPGYFLTVAVERIPDDPFPLRGAEDNNVREAVRVVIRFREGISREILIGSDIAPGFSLVSPIPWTVSVVDGVSVG